MRFPRIILAAVPIGLGIALPALAAPLQVPAPGVIGMSHDGYVVNGVVEDEESEHAGVVPEIVIHVGERLTFQNNSRWIHVVGPGQKGLLAPPGHSAMTPRRLMQEDEQYTTPPWSTPGTYLITCTVHPDMDAKVIVLP